MANSSVEYHGPFRRSVQQSYRLAVRHLVRTFYTSSSRPTGGGPDCVRTACAAGTLPLRSRVKCQTSAPCSPTWRELRPCNSLTCLSTTRNGTVWATRTRRYYNIAAARKVVYAPRLVQFNGERCILPKRRSRPGRDRRWRKRDHIPWLAGICFGVYVIFQSDYGPWIVGLLDATILLFWFLFLMPTKCDFRSRRERLQE